MHIGDRSTPEYVNPSATLITSTLVRLGSDAEVSANERLVDAVLERDGCFTLAREWGPRRSGLTMLWGRPKSTWGVLSEKKTLPTPM